MEAFPASLETTRDLVSARLTTALEEIGSRLAHVGPELGEVLVSAQDFLDGGKRLRAAFCVAAWRACGGASPGPGSPVVAAGAALELFQAAALVHDDVMDGSLTRRGRPSVHRRFALLHGRQAWLGSPRRFGEAAAILLGDLLLVASFREIAAATRLVDPAGALAAREVFDLMTAEVTVGQYLDVYAQTVPWSEDGRTDGDRATRVVRAKSARYSVEHPLVLGAALAGAEPARLAALARFGLPIGEAFQLRDDVLGVFGDPEVTGKPAGDDLREGKRTMLVTVAMERADDADRRTLRSSLGNADLDPTALARIRSILVATGALGSVEARIVERRQAGLTALAEAGLDERSTGELAALAALAVHRRT